MTTSAESLPHGLPYFRFQWGSQDDLTHL